MVWSLNRSHCVMFLSEFMLTVAISEHIVLSYSKTCNHDEEYLKMLGFVRSGTVQHETKVVSFRFFELPDHILTDYIVIWSDRFSYL